MTQDEKKQAVARAAIEHVPAGEVIGVGSGTTANYFIDALRRIKSRVEGAVASSVASAHRLETNGVRVLDLNEVDSMALYVDGADEATRHRHLIKGGGGALTREKIVAEVAKRFLCIVDDSKIVDRLGAFPLPIEVIPMARSHVARELAKRGAMPVLREGFSTDDGNLILDVHRLDITEPAKLESELNQIPGVVASGLFARRPADLLLVGSGDGVQAA